MNSLFINHNRIASRRADAQAWLAGIRDLHKRASKLTQQFVKENESRLAASSSENELDTVTRTASRLERILGAIVVELSPHRPGSPLARTRPDLPGQLSVFSED